MYPFLTIALIEIRAEKRFAQVRQRTRSIPLEGSFSCVFVPVIISTVPAIKVRRVHTFQCIRVLHFAGVFSAQPEPTGVTQEAVSTKGVSGSTISEATALLGSGPTGLSLNL